MKAYLYILIICVFGCKDKVPESTQLTQDIDKSVEIEYAHGFEIEQTTDGVTVIRVLKPWPDAKKSFTYALGSRETLAKIKADKKKYDALVPVPVENIVVTSTTHIPALEALGVGDRLRGFPGTNYISSDYTRSRVDNGEVMNLGNNESINTELTLSLKPDVVVGFSIAAANKPYETLVRSGIPVVYNGDWTEQTPLGKAEWIKFFAPFFQKEEKANILFDSIVQAYTKARDLAQQADYMPGVMSGAIYKDVWYAPGGNSWAAQFIRDANGKYLWDDTEETGSLSLGLESVLARASEAEYWISPSQFTSYSEMKQSNRHYTQFNAFRDKKIYTYALSQGETGGLTFFELGPNRPDLILKDLIHIFNPEILPEHKLHFFKPLQ